MIFVVYGALNKSDTAKPDRIVVSQAKMEQIAGLFARTWQRPPTLLELKGLIDDYVKEEVYNREALALGLDKDDTVIRRRLRQKFEFLGDAEIEALNPTDAELEGIPASKRRQIRDRSCNCLPADLSQLGAARREDRRRCGGHSWVLRSNPSLDPASLGDLTLLPSELTPTSKASISQTFGPEFAEAIAKTTPGTWSGPIKSGFGLHIVRVSDMIPGRMPALAEVRDAVAREWANVKRKELADARFAKLLKRYEVTIEAEPKRPAQAAASP